MSKQIRPLTAFKKANPLYYKDHLKKYEDRGASKKDKENRLYWVYCYLQISNKDDFASEGFFWKKAPNSLEAFNNKLTITELGRLLLTGWYYNIEDYTKEVAGYIHRAYYKKLNAGGGFNDLEYYEVVKHIRENVLYYYNNQPEAKYFILDSLFKKSLQELLPPPTGKLKEHKDLIELLTTIRKSQKKKGIDFWINRSEDLETYSYYLQKILTQLNIDYFSFEEWKANDNKGADEYFNEIEALEKEYRAKVINSTKQIDL